jgi:hypothetical protein
MRHSKTPDLRKKDLHQSKSNNLLNELHLLLFGFMWNEIENLQQFLIATPNHST